MVRVCQKAANISEDFGLYLSLNFVRQLVAIGPEELDAVVLIRVVRRGDHDAEVRAKRSHKHRDSGGRDRAELNDVHADRCEAGDQRRLDDVTGKPRVLPNHDTMAVFPFGKHMTRGHTDF